MIEIKSSLLARYSYDAATQTLTIEFSRRKDQPASPRYHYKPVPQEVVDSFIAAESKGAFYLKEIKPKFACVKEEKDAAAEEDRGNVEGVRQG